MDNTLKFIGEIRTPYKTIDDCPSNITVDGVDCQLVIDDEYKNGLFGLNSGDKILILYWLYNENRFTGMGTSRNSGERKGTFALRSPKRPNPIGVATLKIESIDDNIIHVRGLDCMDKTILLDIKPAMKSELG